LIMIRASFHRRRAGLVFDKRGNMAYEL
jgi:hypothetical protein